MTTELKLVDGWVWSITENKPIPIEVSRAQTNETQVIQNLYILRQAAEVN